jgi:hypothetical protein
MHIVCSNILVMKDALEPLILIVLTYPTTEY